MVTIPSSQNEWTYSLTDAPSKIIINDKLTPLAVKSNIHITDVLIKEVLTDSPLLIIKENINCGKFLDKDKFNLLIGRIRYKSLTDFPQTIIIIDEGLYGEALFHIFSQNEIYSRTYKTDRIMTDFVKFLNPNHFGIDRLHHDYSYTTTQREHKGVEK